ncbi:hypothetical protein [Micromonospora sp. KC723]|uniref:hypothetical protein n=1 Tax=Micromonospora sp. KC723 TaxID=2530381 RepID=UPI00104D39F7|nr:hypothetical protein [Micromonospora sp. KC723]TDB73177.1 hypothetical protein E1165_18070 [Micromonospora sp. KC723]
MPPGIGRPQVNLGLTIYRQAPTQRRSEDSPVRPLDEHLRLSVALYVSPRDSQQDRHYVCRMAGEHLVTVINQQGSFRMRGFISDHQMHVIEEQRAGKRIWLILALQVLQDEGKPARFAQPTGQVSFGIGSGEWAETWRKSKAGPTLSCWCRSPMAPTSLTP